MESGSQSLNSAGGNLPEVMAQAPGSEPVSKAFPALRQETIVTRLVQRENERLTRLLRNLYQEFRLDQGDRTQLYEHICRELAQYFRCDCCQLYLVRQDENAEAVPVAGRPVVKEFLTLMAAFGPWESALRPRYVRRIMPTQYALNSDKHTPRRFRECVARVDICRADYREAEDENRPSDALGCRDDSEPARDAEWHLVWSRDNLYNVSRNIISCPVLRHRSRDQWGPYAVGLIKLENRRPSYSDAFESDYDPQELYLGHYFELCSVAGYVRDLENRLQSADSVDSLLSPMHDGDGWRQHYQQHVRGEPYYQVVFAWQKEMEKLGVTKDTPCASALPRLSELKRQYKEQYKEVSENLSAILDLVVELEVFLQALKVALTQLHPLTTPPEAKNQQEKLQWGDTPVPSFFNVIDLSRAGADARHCLDEVRAAIDRAVQMKLPPCHPDQADQTSKLLSKWMSDTGRTTSTLPIKEDTLWNRLVVAFLTKHTDSGGLLEGDTRKRVAEAMCEFLRTVAQSILAARSRTNPAVLLPEVLGCYESAQGVLQVVKLDDTESEPTAGICQESTGREPSNPERVVRGLIRRFAKALARACLYAHTFDPQVDEPRLYSIQSHVSQIIDNHLIERARRMEISFDQLELLGLTESTIERLEELEKLLQDAARCQAMAAHRWLATHGGNSVGSAEEYRIEARPSAVRQILQELVNCMLHGEQKDFSARLFEVDVRLRAPDIAPTRKSEIEAKLRSALRPLTSGDPLKPRFTFSVEEIFDGTCLTVAKELRRPTPRWLFDLNATLRTFCKSIMMLPEPG